MRLVEWYHVTSPLNGHYWGEVVDDQDPEKLGRIRVKSEIFQDIPDSDLPWCLPVLPGFPGSKNTGTFWVPEVGAEVMIYFPFHDPHLPAYYGRLHTQAKWIHNRFRQNYPKRYGWQDENGNFFLVDKQDKFLRIFHESGVIVHINKDGDVKLLQPATRKLYVTNKDVHFTGNLYVDKHLVVQHWISSPLYTSLGVADFSAADAHNINQIVAKLNAHIAHFNGHTHPVAGGTALPPAPDTPKNSDGTSSGIHDPGAEPTD